MLQTLGYDPHANPPNYGKPDQEVAENTFDIKKNADFWKAQEVQIREKGAHGDSSNQNELNWNGIQPPKKEEVQNDDLAKKIP